jgi:co-chaperonin GroES (HSP10)
MAKPYAPSGRIFVTHDGRWDDEIVTESGIKFFKDTTFRPEHGVRIFGTVATTPLDGKCEVSEGDKVYFHYFTLQYDDNRVTVDKVDYYASEIEQVFVKVVDGNIIPVHGWCLIDIETKEIDHSIIIIPDSVKKKEVNTYGKLMYAPQGCEIPVGSTVFFRDIYAFKNDIEGKEYYLMNQNGIECYQLNDSSL